MTREITQFSTIEYGLLTFEDVEKMKDGPKKIALAMFRDLVQNAKLEDVGGLENIRTVRLLDVNGVQTLDFVTKKPLSQIREERRKAELKRQEAAFIAGLNAIRGELADALVARAAQIILNATGQKYPTQEQIDALAPAAFKQATEEFKKSLLRPPQKPRQANGKAPRSAQKHQGRGKPAPGRRNAQKPTQKLQKAS